jgi:RimJ/RimL family protein N-acetyltransferase
MEIREMQTTDSKQFVEFYEKLANECEYLPIAPEEVDEKTEKILKHIEKENKLKRVFIAVENDKIVGFIGIKRIHFARLRHVAKLIIGVLDDYKRQGIGTKLMEFVEKWAKENEIRKLELTVVEDNDPAVEFFEEMDFEKEGTREKAVKIKGEYLDEIFMAKYLDED